MRNIGIFWIYKNTTIGKVIDVGQGVESIKGMIDSPDNHVDFWDADFEFKQKFPDLRFVEYQDVPRGRVLFLTLQQKPLVYLDKKLLNVESKKMIADFFGFNVVDAIWKKDLHYTTNRIEIDQLFDEF